MAKAKKKIYSGTVINEFKVGYKDATVTYHIGSAFKTTDKESLQYLINIKKIKQ